MSTVLISCVESAQYRGWGVSNGGIKLYALWAKLINQQPEHEAYVVTYDGTFTPWLIEHPSIVSMDTARAWKQDGRDLRWLTGWIVSDAFIELAESFYFFDAEMAYTAGDARHHTALRGYLDAGRIRALGTHSRTIQAWYMATFGVTPHFIREWSDPDHWTPAGSPEAGLVGYMDEGPHTASTIQQLQALVPDARFMRVAGDETDVRDQMRRCDVFLGLNMGKHPLWGEGCPRSPQEAQHVGAIPVAFDVHGNHEYIVDGVTGFMVRRGDINGMAKRLNLILANRNGAELMRRNGLNYAHSVMTPESSLNGVKEFLEL